MQLAEQQVDLFKLSDFMNAEPKTEKKGVSATIGPEGGVVTVIDPASPIFGTSLRIPAGALDVPVQITIREGDHSCAFGLGPSIDLSPGGLQFKRAATLAIYLENDGAEDDDFNSTVPACYRYDTTSDQWTHNGAARLRRLGDTVLCELHHL